MAKQCFRFLSVVLAAWLGVVQPGLALAAAIPSKDPDSPTASPRQSDLSQVRDLLARDEVAKALSARGLTPPEIDRRLAQLSDEDLRLLASNVGQIQAAGYVPHYIWILLAILIVVLIVANI